MARVLRSAYCALDSKSGCLSRSTSPGATLSDLACGALTHPQSNVADFYRELGDLFGVALRAHNRWNKTSETVVASHPSRSRTAGAYPWG
jgi:hypothetical protein